MRINARFFRFSLLFLLSAALLCFVSCGSGGGQDPADHTVLSVRFDSAENPEPITELDSGLRDEAGELFVYQILEDHTDDVLVLYGDRHFVYRTTFRLQSFPDRNGNGVMDEDEEYQSCGYPAELTGSYSVTPDGGMKFEFADPFFDNAQFSVLLSSLPLCRESRYEITETKWIFGDMTFLIGEFDGKSFAKLGGNTPRAEKTTEPVAPETSAPETSAPETTVPQETEAPSGQKEPEKSEFFLLRWIHKIRDVTGLSTGWIIAIGVLILLGLGGGGSSVVISTIDKTRIDIADRSAKELFALIGKEIDEHNDRLDEKNRLYFELECAKNDPHLYEELSLQYERNLDRIKELSDDICFHKGQYYNLTGTDYDSLT